MNMSVSAVSEVCVASSICHYIPSQIGWNIMAIMMKIWRQLSTAMHYSCSAMKSIQYIYIYITIVYWESDHCKIDVNMANEVVFCIGDIYDICIKWLVTCSYYICQCCQLHYVCISIAESQCYVMWRYIRYIITNKA